MTNPLITVFTPTFNRANTVYRVWDSLNSQTFKDFEWVVIDDGSEDNIEEQIKEYINIANFNINFFKFKDNKGKHNATNKALELAKGRFFIVADSDDAFTPNALEVFYQTWQSIPEIQQKNYCGVRACCIDENGNRVSDILPQSPMDGSMAELFYKYAFRKESWCMVLTEWHRKFLFPTEHKGYYPEGIIWKAMSKTKKLRFVNETTRIYFTNDSENSIMRQPTSPYKKISRNVVVGEDILNNDINYFIYYPTYFFLSAILYLVYSI
jgi:glycosyltransferase involved in cell wall biosynthesis